MEVKYGIKFEVDHIHPLKHGGLHAPWNWQVISKSDNGRKKVSLTFEDYRYPRWVHPEALNLEQEKGDANQVS